MHCCPGTELALPHLDTYNSIRTVMGVQMEITTSIGLPEEEISQHGIVRQTYAFFAQTIHDKGSRATLQFLLRREENK